MKLTYEIDILTSFFGIIVFKFLPVVLLDVVQVITPDDDGPVHLHLGDDSGQDTSTDGDFAGEGTLLVDIVSGLGLVGDLETQAGVAEEPGL